MKKQLCLLILWMPLIIMAQTTNENNNERKGIKWATGLSWEQVKQKAKAENKYIFLDAYTTWCGPCKMMDKIVFNNDTVGDFFNQYFISVKVQMDKTSKDDEYVKSWYKDASAIEKEYVVDAYPTAIFFSPGGMIVHKDGGFRPMQDFISMAKLALTPGKVYEDPYAEYKRLVNEYKQGIKQYDRMSYMINTAFKIGDADFARSLFHDHLKYASALNEKERYTKENIEVWTAFILNPGSKVLGFFVKDGDKIDKVMNQQGYSRGIVDKNIQSTIVDSFFRMQKGETVIAGVRIPNSNIMFVQLAQRSDGKPLELNDVEAEWKKLKSMITKYFNNNYAERNVFTAKVRWYKQLQNIAAASKMYFLKLDKWPPSDLNLQIQYEINEFSWYTFLNETDKTKLNKCAMWMEKVIQQKPVRDEPLDTYANLLYKMGRVTEAIQWEEKALQIVSAYPMYENEKKIYRDVIEKMKKGEPTYLEQGAIWTNK